MATLLRIQLPCPACIGHDDSQPNFCRKCGGGGRLYSTVTPGELSRMGEIPDLFGASVVIEPRQRAKKRARPGERAVRQ